MRRIRLSRKNTGEQGDPRSGYYGGIRKLHNEDEIEKWKKLFPSQVQVHATWTLLVTILHILSFNVSFL